VIANHLKVEGQVERIYAIKKNGKYLAVKTRRRRAYRRFDLVLSVSQHRVHIIKNDAHASFDTVMNIVESLCAT